MRSPSCDKTIWVFLAVTLLLATCTGVGEAPQPVQGETGVPTPTAIAPTATTIAPTPTKTKPAPTATPAKTTTPTPVIEPGIVVAEGILPDLVGEGFTVEPLFLPHGSRMAEAKQAVTAFVVDPRTGQVGNQICFADGTCRISAPFLESLEIDGKMYVVDQTQSSDMAIMYVADDGSRAVYVNAWAGLPAGGWRFAVGQVGKERALRGMWIGLDGNVVVEKLSHILPIQPGNQVRIDQAAGLVTIIGTDGQTVDIGKQFNLTTAQEMANQRDLSAWVEPMASSQGAEFSAYILPNRETHAFNLIGMVEDKQFDLEPHEFKDENGNLLVTSRVNTVRLRANGQR